MKTLQTIAAIGIPFIGIMSIPYIAFTYGHASGVSDALNHPEKYRPVSTTQWVEINQKGE